MEYIKPNTTRQSGKPQGSAKVNSNRAAQPTSRGKQPNDNQKGKVVLKEVVVVNHNAKKDKNSKPKSSPPKVELDVVVSNGSGRIQANPSRATGTESTVFKDMIQFGPKMAIDHNRPSEVIRSVGISVTADWCCSIAAAICSYASNFDPGFQAYTGTTPINMNYVYQFLANYILNVASGVVNSPQLTMAPAVFYDVLYALAPRRRGNVSFFPVTSGSVGASTASSRTCNTPFGIQGTASGFGYYNIITTGSGYTSALGYANCMTLFASLSSSLDVVSLETYKDPWARDETGLYVYLRGSVDVSATQRLFGCIYNNVDFGGLYYGSCVWLGRKPCEWLMRIAPGKTSLGAHPYSAGKQIPNYTCSPASMIVHRIINKLRGYKGQFEQPLVKPVDIGALYQLWDFMLHRAGAVAGTKFLATNFIGQNDAKLFWFLTVAQYFMKWQSVCVGMYDTRSGTVQRFIPSGSFSMSNDMSNWANFAFFYKNLACLYPYKKGNVTIYPCLIVGQEAAPSDSTDYAATDSWFTKVWAWNNNAVVTLGDTCISLTNAASGGYANWAQAMQQFAPYLPTSSFIDEQPMNAACVTRYGTIGSNSYANSVVSATSSNNIPDHVRPILAQLFVPFFPLATLDQRDEYMSLYRESQIDILSGQPFQSSWAFPAQAVLQAVHPLGGFGALVSQYASDEIPWYSARNFYRTAQDFFAADEVSGRYSPSAKEKLFGTTRNSASQNTKQDRKWMERMLILARDALPERDYTRAVIEAVLDNIDAHTMVSLAGLVTALATPVLGPLPVAPVNFDVMGG